MKKGQKILIADMDEKLARSAAAYLSGELFDVKVLSDTASAAERIRAFPPDAVILDPLQPKTDGLQIIRGIRQKSQVPIIVTSARSDVFSRVLALEIGADDYLVKPYDMRELSARLKALLRRAVLAEKELSSRSGHPPIEYPDLKISLETYSVVYKGALQQMPPKEIELLYFLAASPNQVFTRQQLLNHIWGYDYVGDTRTVDVHMKRLRKKIHDTGKWSLSTVWGVGYKFELKEKGL